MRPMSDLHRTTQTKQQRQKAVNNPIKPLSKINTQYDIKIDRDEFPHWLHSFIYSCIYLSTDLLLLLFLVRNELAEWLQRCHFSNFDLAITWFAYHQLLHFPGKKKTKMNLLAPPAFVTDKAARKSTENNLFSRCSADGHFPRLRNQFPRNENIPSTKFQFKQFKSNWIRINQHRMEWIKLN